MGKGSGFQWGRRIVTAAMCATVLAPATADAQTQSVALPPSGTLTYTWTASPALGCAQVGVCGISGAAIFTAQDAGLLPLRHGRGELLIDGSTIVRTAGPGSDTGCVDTNGGGSLALTLGVEAARQSVDPAAQGVETPSAGRCAGPTAADTARLAIEIVRRGATLDLHGIETEDAGPFIVTLRSSLRVHPQVTRPAALSSLIGLLLGALPHPHGRQHRHRAYVETARVGYGLTASNGQVTAQFHAGGEPFCAGLGACGDSGNVTATLLGGQLTLVLRRTVRKRPTPGTVLQALRDGRLSGLGGGRVRIRVSESVSGGGLGCSASRTQTVQAVVASRRGLFELGLPPQLPGGDELRTSCPGPDDSDLLGQFGPLAAGATFGAKPDAPVSLLVSQRSRFADRAYAGAWSGAISVALAPSNVRVSVRQTEISSAKGSVPKRPATVKPIGPKASGG